MGIEPLSPAVQIVRLRRGIFCVFGRFGFCRGLRQAIRQQGEFRHGRHVRLAAEQRAAAQEETEYGTVYDGAALQPYLYQCSEVTEVVSSMDRPMHLNVRYKTQDDIEASLEIDYDVIVLRSVYYPDEDAYALEQMGVATWMTHFRYEK